MKFTEIGRLDHGRRRWRVTGKRLWMTVTVLFAAAATTALATRGGIEGRGDDRDEDHDRGRYAIGLWGDLPYSDVQAQTGVPNLIADMNSQDLAFTAHDGDLKAGNGISGSTTPTTCADPLYLQGLAHLNSLRAPAMFTPGDNDWADCDRAKNGSFNSLERLDNERAIFFNDSFSLGQHRLRHEVQKTPLCLGVSGPVQCASRIAVGRSAVLPMQRSTSRARATISVTPLLTRRSSLPVTRPTSHGCRRPLLRPRNAIRLRLC